MFGLRGGPYTPNPIFLSILPPPWATTTQLRRGRVAAIIRCHINGLIPLESTIGQTTETMALTLKQ